MDNKLPDGYISKGELIELSGRNKDTVNTRLIRAGVKGEFFQRCDGKRILIFPRQAALDAVLDKHLKHVMTMQHEWVICTLADAEEKLNEMRDKGWYPISHSIWYDVRSSRTMASFIFRKKIDPISEKRKADMLDMMRAMIDGSK